MEEEEEEEEKEEEKRDVMKFMFLKKGFLFILGIE